MESIELSPKMPRPEPPVLGAVGVLGPADRVGEGGGLLATRVLADLLAHLQEEVLRDWAR